MAQVPFDQRNGIIWMDGHYVEWSDARVHVLTHAMHYGSAVFEGQRAYEGQIFKLNQHTERLFASAKMLDMDPKFTPDEINAACNELLVRNRLKDAYCRPIFWRGAETMGVAAQQTEIHAAIAVWEWPAYFSFEQRQKGLRLQMSRWRRPGPDMAPVHAKASGLYMICTLSRHEAEAKGYDDALMLDYQGKVAEATGANIFFVKDGDLLTPPADCFLDGITRRTVMALARREGVNVVERKIELDELASFEQAFLTGTAAEVSPIREIGDFTFEVGELSTHLMRLYDNEVRLPQAQAA